MKISIVAKSALVMASLFLPSIAAAEPGYMTDIKLALTLSYMTPGTFEREFDGGFRLDEDGVRIPAESNTYSPDDGATILTEQVRNLKSFKFGTRELLEALLERGYFPEEVESIRGWSLKEVTDTVSLKYYLYKKGTAPLRLTDGFGMIFDSAVTKRNLKTKVRRDSPKGALKSTSATGSELAKGWLELDLTDGVAGFRVYLEGRATGTFINKFTAGGDFPLLTRTLKATGIAGTGEFELGPIYAEGSVSTGRVVLLDDVGAEFPTFYPDPG